jgi:hypothetical protein
VLADAVRDGYAGEDLGHQLCREEATGRAPPRRYSPRPEATLAYRRGTRRSRRGRHKPRAAADAVGAGPGRMLVMPSRRPGGEVLHHRPGGAIWAPPGGVADVGRPAVPGAAWPGADRRPPPSPGLCPGARRWKGATLHPDQPAHWHLEALGVRQCTEPICTTASVVSASSSPRRNPVRARNSTTSPDERPGARGAAPGTWGRRWRRRSGAAARRGWAGHRRTREVWRGQFS